SAGASIIFDADDDNIPYEAFLVGSFQHTVSLIPNTLFFNAYRHFTDKFIWPRGFPLDLVRDKTAYALQETEQREVGIWQYVADLDPDVDAIYRLLFDEPVTFERSEPFVLPTNVYCPINSQSTAWQPKAFPFLYLPISVSFRFTDILRGYVAQRLLWEQGLQVGFGPAQAYQERNPHNLFADLEDEVPVYLNAHKLVSILDSLTLSGKGLADLRTVYEALYENDIVQAHELASVDAWIADCRDIL
ncbi:MAG: STELLO glycosyltransferase family protein, partial [Candidatus Promineifilaceae bacterium]